MREKLIFALGGIILSLLACLASYWYGEETGRQLEKSSWETREAARVAGTATVAIQHTDNVVAEVKNDQSIERKNNAQYEQAMADLASARRDNDRLVRLNGGLRISAQACAGRSGPEASSEASGTGISTGADPGTIALPEQVDADLRDQADEADTILERYRTLRTWCFDQGYCRISTETVP